jgi:hypothetical protein
MVSFDPTCAMEMPRSRGSRNLPEPSIHFRERAVSVRRRTDWHLGRLLGISLLIAGVVRVPLPQADYHNVRHHDAPGEICLLHDHLLRWHPSAASNADVALFHWHWFVPLAESDDPYRQNGDDPQGPVLHAHFTDWPEPDWLDEPVIGPDVRGRFSENRVLSLATANCAYLEAHFAPIASEPGSLALFAPGAGAGLRADRAALFERWNC